MEEAPKQIGEFVNFHIYMDDSEEIGKMSRSLIEYGAKLMWEHVNNIDVNLIIAYSNAEYKLPFVKRGSSLHAVIDYLPVYHDQLLGGFKEAIESLEGSAQYKSLVEGMVGVDLPVREGEVVEIKGTGLEGYCGDVESPEENNEWVGDKIKNEVSKVLNYTEMDVLLEELSRVTLKGRYRGRADDIRSCKKLLTELREEIALGEGDSPMHD